MQNESSNEAAIPDTKSVGNHIAADLKFMRSVFEKTNRAFDPGSPVMIVWGMIFLVGFPLTQFLSKPQLLDFIQPMWIILWVIGACMGIFNGVRSDINQKKAGVIPQIANQLGLIWYILLLNATVWSGMELFNVYVGMLAFLWAIIFAIGLSIMGILSTKEWLSGGIAIFISIVAAAIIKEYALPILGIAMGLGCIIPAIIAKNNYRKQEQENAQD